MNRKVGAFVTGFAAIGALTLAGCSTSNSPSPDNPPTHASSPSSSPSTPTTITKTNGDWKLTLTTGDELPSGWPLDVPAPNNGSIAAAGEAQQQEVKSKSEYRAVLYEIDQEEEVAIVQAEQQKQAKSAGWTGGKFVNGSMQFDKEEYVLYITVTPSPDGESVYVYQWTNKSSQPQTGELPGTTPSAAAKE